MIQKRGQITIFMIIGIVLLFSTALIFYVREKVQTSEIGINLASAEKTPLETRAVKTYVESCIEQIAIQGLDKLGKNGGYINPEQIITPIPLYSKDSEGIVQEPTTLPFWSYYDDSAERYKSHRPNLCAENCDQQGPNSIEEQLSNYISQNLGACIQDFGALNKIYKITPQGQITTFVTVTEEDVAILLDYPLQIELLSTGSKTKMKKFLTRVAVPMKGLYNFATKLINLEMNKTTFEVMTLQMLNIYSGLDKDIPPQYAMSLGGQDKIWIMPNVKKIIDQDILDLIKLTQVSGTKLYSPYSVEPGADNYELRKGLYSMLNIFMGNESSDYKVRFNHPQKQLYLSINNQQTILTVKDSATAQDDSILSMLMSSIIKKYQFSYDMSYPVILKIDDLDALNGRGYSLQIAMEICLQKNKPCKARIQLPGVSPQVSFNLGSLNQRINRSVTVEVKDSKTKQPIPEVNIGYYCGEKYSLSQTSSQGQIEDKFPYCRMGGYITAQKLGYFYNPIKFDNDGTVLTPIKIMVNMTQVITKRIDVRKLNTDNLTKLQQMTGMSIQQFMTERRTYSENTTANDSVLLMVSKIKKNPIEQTMPMNGFLNIAQQNTNAGLSINIDEQIQTLEKNKNSMSQAEYDQALKELQDAKALQQSLPADAAQVSSSIQVDKSMDLIPGDYTIDILLMHQQKFNVSEKELDLDFDDDECPDNYACREAGHDTDKCCVSPIEIPSGWVTGGAKINVTITDQMLDSDKEIVFYTMEYPLPKTIDDIKGPELENASIDNRMYLEPSLG